MRFRKITLLVVVGVALAVAYLWLAGNLAGRFARSGWPAPQFLAILGRRSAAITWMEVLNSSAVLVASAPVVIAACAIFGRRAWIVVLIAAVPISALSLCQSLYGVSWHQFLSADPVIHVVDCIKLVGIPILLVLAMLRSPLTRVGADAP